MKIKLSDYIKDPEQALSEEDWIIIYAHALMDNGELDEKLAEDFLEVSNEALKIELSNDTD